MTSPRRFARVLEPSVVVAMIAVAPILVAVLHARRAGWVPLGDHGLIELRATDVLTSDHPWLGTWTSASLSTGTNLNNPGPLLFDALAPFVKLLGISTGAVIGVAAINAAACVLGIWQGHRFSGRRGALLAAVAFLSLEWTMGSEMLVDPWQPHVLQLPFLAFLVCASALAAGRTTSLAWLVGIASFLVQSHLSFTYVVAVVGATAMLLWWLAIRRESAGESIRRPVLIAVGVGIGCWLQPLYEQFFEPGQGNLSRLLGATGSSADTIGFASGTRLVSRVVALPPWFLRPSFESSVRPTPLSADGRLRLVSQPSLALALVSIIVVGGLMIALARTAGRTGDRPLRAGLIVAATAVAAAVVTMVVMPIGPLGLASHQLRWLWPISILVWWQIAAAVVLLVPPLRVRSTGSRGHLAMGVALLLAIAGVPSHTTDAGPATDRVYRSVVASMIDQLDAVRLREPAVFDPSTLRFAEPFSGPALLVLLDNDQPITVADEGFVRQLGEGRRASGAERWSLQILEGDDAVALPPDATVLAYADGLSASDRAELDELRTAGADTELRRVLEAAERARAVAVVLIPRV